MIFCLSSGDIVFSSICESVSELFLGELFLILLAILSSIKSPAASAVFWNSLFENFFKYICCRLFKSCHKGFTYIFTDIFAHIFTKRQNSTTFYKYYISRFSWITYNFLFVTLELITKIIFSLSFISNTLELWSINHISTYENAELQIFENIKLLGKISNNWANYLLETNIYKTLVSC